MGGHHSDDIKQLRFLVHRSTGGLEGSHTVYRHALRNYAGHHMGLIH